MSIEFFECSICGEGMNDCMPCVTCAQCEEVMCEECEEEQKKKYGLCSKESDIENFGEDALAECDKCSSSTLEKRIHQKKDDLKSLENELDLANIQQQIDEFTRELKDCTNDSRYEVLWNKRLELKQMQST